MIGCKVAKAVAKYLHGYTVPLEDMSKFGWNIALRRMVTEWLLGSDKWQTPSKKEKERTN